MNDNETGSVIFLQYCKTRRRYNAYCYRENNTCGHLKDFFFKVRCPFLLIEGDSVTAHNLMPGVPIYMGSVSVTRPCKTGTLVTA